MNNPLPNSLLGYVLGQIFLDFINYFKSNLFGSRLLQDTFDSNLSDLLALFDQSFIQQFLESLFGK